MSVEGFKVTVKTRLKFAVVVDFPDLRNNRYRPPVKPNRSEIERAIVAELPDQYGQLRDELRQQIRDGKFIVTRMAAT